jgi:hypothetical protein
VAEHRALWATAIAVVMLAGCGPQKPEGYYDIAPAVAYDLLRRADTTGFRDARQCGMLIYFFERDDGSNTVTWDVRTKGVSVAGFRLHVTPSGNGSVVSIELPKAPNGNEIYDGQQHYAHPAFMQPMRPALREFVDATLEQRPYDWHRIPDPLNTDGLCASMLQNFEASGQPYDIDDPSGMTHQQAEDARANGVDPRVETDQVFAGADPWAR